ncbi:receptor-interacting serine/threonine-protein kinase 3 isoform X1 [Alosa alosa]|nr:receptor-interacting serine/threonine-protein kinase 3 isoform X1 [Alosa alosa]
MELSTCQEPVLIRDDSLVSWEVIGSGGFGQIHRAKHVRWGMDVAVKVLHHSDGSGAALRKEAEMMRQGSNPFVLRILGVYQGCPPVGGPSLSSQLGLVMEFMERGSLAGLHEALGGPPPWPLAFRLAHQVALGMNFLHCMSPPLLHLDLKPSNVLLDSYLNARLTDFGLAKLARSVSRRSREADDETGGTISYMPPEAFNLSYKPTSASDVYSYGVLLWSIFTGKEPYANALSSLVRFRIPLGDRPDLESLDVGNVEGLTEITELMKKCWQKDPTQRPTFEECHPVTNHVLDLHKRGINEAVYNVQTKLDSDSEASMRNSHIETVLAPPPPTPVHACIQVCSEAEPQKDTGSCKTSQLKHKPEDSVKKHSHQPITAASQRHKTSSSSSNHKQHVTPTSFFPHYQPSVQRQHSSPVPKSGYGKYKANTVSHNLTNLQFVQIGDNNRMHVNITSKKQRHRNPTAPSRVNLPASQADPFKPEGASTSQPWDTHLK